MANPFLDREARAGIGGTGRKAERKTAKRLGGRLTPASGALDSQKGDFATKDWLCENKSTVNASLGVKLAWLEKITREALPNGKTPALSIQFTDGDGAPLKSGSWVCIPEHVFKELLDVAG